MKRIRSIPVATFCGAGSWEGSDDEKGTNIRLYGVSPLQVLWNDELSQSIFWSKLCILLQLISPYPTWHMLGCAHLFSGDRELPDSLSLMVETRIFSAILCAAGLERILLEVVKAARQRAVYAPREKSTSMYLIFWVTEVQA